MTSGGNELGDSEEAEHESAHGELGVRFSLADLAHELGGTLSGDGRIVITGINAIADASPSHITFAITNELAARLPQSRAGAVVVSRDVEVPPGFGDRPVITVANAEHASMALLHLFSPPPVLPEAGIHSTAFIHPSAKIGQDVCIGPHVSIDRNVVIGTGCVFHAGVRIYADVTVGDDCLLHANAVVRERCVLGDRVVLNVGAVIGSEGFGFRPGQDGSSLRRMPHLGNVILEDDVEIGASTCVDRAKFSSTVVGRGAKVDNLVQIAHNCRIGRHCVIAGCCGIGGSVTIEDWVQIGGNTSIPEHNFIGRGAKITAHSMVFGDIPSGTVWGGFPARPWRETLRHWSALRKLVRSAERNEGSARPSHEP